MEHNPLIDLYHRECERHDETRQRLDKENADLRERLRKTTEALYFAVAVLEDKGYTDVEVKRGKAIIAENDAASKAYWDNLCNSIRKSLSVTQ